MACHKGIGGSLGGQFGQALINARSALRFCVAVHLGGSRCRHGGNYPNDETRRDSV